MYNRKLYHKTYNKKQKFQPLNYEHNNNYVQAI